MADETLQPIQIDADTDETHAHAHIDSQADPQPECEREPEAEVAATTGAAAEANRPEGGPQASPSAAGGTASLSSSSSPASKWKEKALQLKGYLDATAKKLRSASKEADEAKRKLAERASELASKDDIIRQLRGRAQEFLRNSDDTSKQRAAEIARLSSVVAAHEAEAEKSRTRRSRPVQVALRIQDTREHGDIWCLVDYEKVVSNTSSSKAAAVESPDSSDNNGSSSSSSSTATATTSSSGNRDSGQRNRSDASGSRLPRVVSEWEKQDSVVERVRQTFGLDLALPPVITSADILSLRSRIRQLEDDLAGSKEAFRKYRVRQELALRQQANELKQARREVEKNFSMRVKHLAETDMEGELKTCRRQLKWLEEENEVSQTRLSEARNSLELKTMEAQGLSEQLLEKSVEIERLTDELHRTQQDHRKQALAGAIARMGHPDSGSAEHGGLDNANEDQPPEASMNEEELRRHLAGVKVRARKLIAEKVQLLDAARSRCARLEHRLASFEQIKDRGYDIDVTAVEESSKAVAGDSAGASATSTPVRTNAGPITPVSGGGQRASATATPTSSRTPEELSAQETLAKVEYLRNLVLQYMSSSDVSTRKQMEVTIGSILKFSPADIQRMRSANRSPGGSITGRLWSMLGK